MNTHPKSTLRRIVPAGIAVAALAGGAAATAPWWLPMEDPTDFAIGVDDQGRPERIVQTERADADLVTSLVDIGVLHSFEMRTNGRLAAVELRISGVEGWPEEQVVDSIIFNHDGTVREVVPMDDGDPCGERVVWLHDDIYRVECLNTGPDVFETCQLVRPTLAEPFPGIDCDCARLVP